MTTNAVTITTAASHHEHRHSPPLSPVLPLTTTVATSASHYHHRHFRHFRHRRQSPPPPLPPPPQVTASLHAAWGQISPIIADSGRCQSPLLFLLRLPFFSRGRGAASNSFSFLFSGVRGRRLGRFAARPARRKRSDPDATSGYS